MTTHATGGQITKRISMARNTRTGIPTPQKPVVIAAHAGKL